MSAANVLQVERLCVEFATRQGRVRAVDQVSFELEESQTTGLVGESGSGKSVTCLALMGLLPVPPATVAAAALRFDGTDLTRLAAAQLRALRGDRIAMVFQDPMTSLNPFLTVGRQLTEVLEVHRRTDRRAARRLAATALAEVGIGSPEERLASYPHELSGGMRQRVMIAMALLCKPKLLIADEPTTALDVTIQAQILDLFADLRQRHGTAILLVTHSLGVVAGLADRVHVMYAGRIVESGAVDSLLRRPQHPYTRGLLASVPALTRDPNVPLESIPGHPPDLAHLPPGCAFAPRCAHALERCRGARPELEPVAVDEPTGARSACLRTSELALAWDRAPSRGSV